MVVQLSLLIVCLCHAVSSFILVPKQKVRQTYSSGRSNHFVALQVTASNGASDEERAAALSNYLAKAHVEKLKAIQEAEAKSKVEIDQLKREIQQLKGSPSSSSSSDPTSSALVAKYSQVDPLRTKILEDLSKEELMVRILQYQDQMQAYMVKSMQERTKAVEAAETAAKQKLAETLKLLAPQKDDMYEARNAAVKRAGEKSRWGAQEVARVSGKSISEDASPKILPSSRAVFGGGAAPPPKLKAEELSPVPSEVIEAADHGLRADGGVEGPSLAERLAQGSNLGSSSSSPTEPLYDKRNAKIHASAGKSRWGSQEVNRLEKPLGMAPRGGLMFTAKPGFLPSSVATFNGAAAPPAFQASAQDVSLETIEAADHGLRADGGVGGMTLLERVTKGPNVRARIVQNASSQDKKSSDSSLYAKRNDKLSLAAKKSRWGTQEIHKINSPSGVGVARGAASSTALPGSSVGSTLQVDASVIEAADHGLRSDGGVGGPTLADRVASGYANFGAQLVAAAAQSSPSSNISSLYDLRSAKLMNAQGKSRWGGAELKKLTSATPIGSIIGSPATSALPGSPTTPQPVDPNAIQAADHGMRADGGVGGPSLAERVNSASANVGAQLVAAASSSLYDRRNARLKAAAAAGKSRWGQQELKRIQTIGSLPPATKVVGLDQRVNFGANLVLNQ